MELIDKVAVVAEIERRRDESWLGEYTKEKGIIFDITDEILSFIDTLEVKEVDIKEESYNIFKHRFLFLIDSNEEAYLFAKHFFELGLKTNEE